MLELLAVLSVGGFLAGVLALGFVLGGEYYKRKLVEYQLLLASTAGQPQRMPATLTLDGSGAPTNLTPEQLEALEMGMPLEDEDGDTWEKVS